jgi:AraC family transcriptional regulator
MSILTDFTAIAPKFPVPLHELDLVYEREKNLSGAVHYAIQRFRMQPHWEMEELGAFIYHYKSGSAGGRYLELRFCVSGNTYCDRSDCSPGTCKEDKKVCHSQETVDFISVRYTPAYLRPFVKGKPAQSKSEEILSFKQKSSFSKTVQICNRTRTILEELLVNNYSNALENIYVNSRLQALLLFGLECLVEEKSEESFSCRFLANDKDREKIILARDILLQRIGDPITIKELSRKVGTNECYLKKGFKELFGTTVFEYYQSQRMEHAKYLLYEKGLSVTEVSVLLGYSSISHFSTAFKKHTGLKPCELLLR